MQNMELDHIKDNKDIGSLHISGGPMVNGKYHSAPLPIVQFRNYIKEETEYLQWIEQNDYYLERLIKENPNYQFEDPNFKTTATSREITEFIYKHQLIINYTNRGLRVRYWKANQNMLFILIDLAQFMDCFLFLNNKMIFEDDISRMGLEHNSTGLYPLYR